MTFRVLATAGHVDHGKSTLVEALTGTHPDRLKEEREREMSIDLGFAYLSLPGGLEVGIVDVPGHRDFIANMLAGVGGVDAFLLVVAADEGVMPQTREHVAILDLLGIHAGVVALTKTDLAPDPAWLDLVETEVRDLLRTTAFAQIPIVRVSVHTRAGLDDLRATLARVLAQTAPRPDRGRPRLPIDRAFALPGFGTVVTGTLVDGTFSVGETVEILPKGLQARIRGMQSHHRPIERARPGSRVALNLAGVAHQDLERGDVVVRPGTYTATTRLDVQIRVLVDAPAALRHMQELKCHIWASEVMARLRLLGRDHLLPGEVGFGQLELRRPVVLAVGDRFILRRPSPEATLAGGVVLDPYPTQSYRRGNRRALERLTRLARAYPVERLWAWLHQARWMSEAEVLARLTAEEAQQALDTGQREGWLVVQETRQGPFAVLRDVWQALARAGEDVLRAFHARFPLREGMPVAAWQAQMTQKHGLPAALAEALLRDLEQSGRVRRSASLLALAQFSPQMPPALQEQAASLLRQGYARLRDLEAALGQDALHLLMARGDILPLDATLAVSREAFQDWLARLRDLFARSPELTVAQVRDALGLSRRVVVAFLEYLDARGYTRREGDVRRWLGDPPSP